MFRKKLGNSFPNFNQFMHFMSPYEHRLDPNLSGIEPTTNSTLRKAQTPWNIGNLLQMDKSRCAK